MTKFKPGGEYKTRDGRRARIYAVDGAIHCPIHGAILYKNDGWVLECWRLTGSVTERSPSSRDLIPLDNMTTGLVRKDPSQ